MRIVALSLLISLSSLSMAKEQLALIDVMDAHVEGSWVKTMEKFAAAGGDLSGVHEDWDGGTLLHIAVLEKKRKAIKWLVENGANIDAQDIDGNTPLHLAIELDFDDYLEKEITSGFPTSLLLMELGANPDIRNKHGESPKRVLANDADLTGIKRIWERLFVIQPQKNAEKAEKERLKAEREREKAERRAQKS